MPKGCASFSPEQNGKLYKTAVLAFSPVMRLPTRGRRNRFFKKPPPKVNAFGGGSESSIKSRFFLYFQSHAVVSRPKAVFPLRAFQSFPKGKIVVRIVRHHIRGMYVGYLSPQKFPFHRRIVGQSHMPCVCARLVKEERGIESDESGRLSPRPRVFF